LVKVIWSFGVTRMLEWHNNAMHATSA